MIALAQVVKRYRMGEEDIRALDGVDLHIERNEYVALVGPSGSGKSTLMNLIGCLDSPSEGTCVINGRNASTMSDDELAQVRNREVGFVFQSFHLLPRLTVLQNVMQPLVFRGMAKPEREQRARDALHSVGLSNRATHRPNQLSGGQRQRVAIARALVGEPPIVLADEPTGNLDSRTSAEIMGVFDELHQRGQTIVLVTHEPDIARHCERTIRLADGRIALDSGGRTACSATA